MTRNPLALRNSRVSLSLQNCSSYPAAYLDYFFGDEETGDDAKKTTPTTEVATATAELTPPTTATRDTETATVTTTARTQPPQSIGGLTVPYVDRGVGFMAQVMGAGVSGLKRMVDSSTTMTVNAVNSFERANDHLREKAQGALTRGAVKVVDQLGSWKRSLDTYRRAFGGSKKTADGDDGGHGITLHLGKDAPLEMLYGFANDWGPNGVETNTVIPTIKSIDLSNLFG